MAQQAASINRATPSKTAVKRAVALASDFAKQIVKVWASFSFSKSVVAVLKLVWKARSSALRFCKAGITLANGHSPINTKTAMSRMVSSIEMNMGLLSLA